MRTAGRGQSRWLTAHEITGVVNASWGGPVCTEADVHVYWTDVEAALRGRGLDSWGCVIGAVAGIAALSPSFQPVYRADQQVQEFVDRGLPALAQRGDWLAIREQVGPSDEGWARFMTLVRRFEALLAHRSVQSRGRMRAGQVIRGATDGYCSVAGSHGGYPAADIFAAEGTPIFSPCDGLSTPAMRRFGGLCTVVQGEDGRTHYLAHGAVPFLGGSVARGQLIGRVGSSGTGAGGFAATGGAPPHLHYAIADDGNVQRGERAGSGNVWVPATAWGEAARRSRQSGDRDGR